MSRWWRAYSDALTDPKLQNLRPATFKCWFNLLCIAAKNEGHIPPVSALTAFCQSDVRHLTAHCEALVQARLIEVTEGGFTPHNWQKRQYKSDVSTPRVKRFRKGGGNVSETPPEQNRTEQIKKESCSNEFERFWKAYPRRVGKKVAEKALAKALRETSIETITEALSRQVPSWTDPKFIPHPATWLNAGRWSDDIGHVNGSPRKVFSPEEIEAGREWYRRKQAEAAE